jgi:hypothetical protein
MMASTWIQVAACLAYRELFMADWFAVFLAGSARSVWGAGACKLTCAGFSSVSGSEHVLHVVRYDIVDLKAMLCSNMLSS